MVPGAEVKSSAAVPVDTRSRDADSTHGAKASTASPAAPGAASASTYASSDAAAKAALTKANPESKRKNKEFGGVIYKDGDGKFGYTEPVEGTDQG